MQPVTESLLYKWQRMSNACVHAGKPPGGPWTIQVTGRCPVTGLTMGIQATGTTDLLHSAMDALLAAPEFATLFADERLMKILSKTT